MVVYFYHTEQANKPHGENSHQSRVLVNVHRAPIFSRGISDDGIGAYQGKNDDRQAQDEISAD